MSRCVADLGDLADRIACLALVVAFAVAEYFFFSYLLTMPLPR